MPFSVSAMESRIIEDRRGWFLPWCDFTQNLTILFQQGIHGLNHLSSHATHDAKLAFSFPSVFVVRTFGLDQALVEIAPLCFLPGQIRDNEERHLTHGPTPSRCHTNPHSKGLH